MSQNLLQANLPKIEEMRRLLDEIEVNLLQYQLGERIIVELIEVGFWANELLSCRIAYTEREALKSLLHRTKFLQKLYLKTAFDLRAEDLLKELKSLIPEGAWRVFLRLDELREIESTYFHGSCLSEDFNQELVMEERELRARLSALNLKTF